MDGQPWNVRPSGALSTNGRSRRTAMKINLEIDCTPDEARRFFGLPDVAPMQEAIMTKLQERMMQAVDATTPEALMRAWVPMAPELMQQGMNALFGAFMKKQADAKKD
jgi:uncharacterized protein DUF6489